MRKLRVLIVDDSVVVRRLLTDILSAEPDIEVVGAVGNGALALAKLTQSKPDVVTLDVEMPGMNGLDLLLEIRKGWPQVAVIMFSALTQRAAATTLDALARGAVDYVTKPGAAGGREAAAQQVRAELVGKIRELRTSSGARASLAPARSPRLPALGVRSGPPSASRLELVVVGSSTGGPNALAELFRELPATFPLPILIAQHMPPLFTKLLAERLSASCRVRFEEGRAGAVLEPGKAWIAPGDHHMRVARRGTQLVLTLDQGQPENSCRPAVDPLFRSAAEACGGAVLAIVLTGMGQDGLRGSEALAARGAQILVQDEKTSVVWSMPGSVAKAGLAHGVLPLAELAAELQRRVRVTTRASMRVGS
jgi:two-component system, chemotaxis family, protein-glutamate methylesterase/glutaminase